MANAWVLNTLESHWDHCVRGPTDGTKHPDHHLGEPWHGIPEGGRSPDPSRLDPGDLFIVREKGIGVRGIWTFEEARRVTDQSILADSWRDHDGEMLDYEWILYCRGQPERELSTPFREDWTGDFPLETPHIMGTAIGSEEVIEAYVSHLLSHSISESSKSRLRDVLETEVEEDSQPADYEQPDRTRTESTRPIRDTTLTREVKETYDDVCMVCGDTRLKAPSDTYSEAHHLKPLGRPHEGPDNRRNILVLCPNHHADFDYGMIRVDPMSLEITHTQSDTDGSTLEVAPDHDIDEEFLRYHNEQIAKI